MKKVKMLFLSVLLVVLALAVAACGKPGDNDGGDDDDKVYVASITLNKSTIGTAQEPFIVGDTAQLNATISPDNATNKGITWRVTSGSEYASVDGSGLVTALKASGAANVIVTATAADGGPAGGDVAEATCKVTVSRPASGSAITTAAAFLNMAPNGTYTLGGDIDFGGATIEPFAEFSGTLDGKGYTLANFKLVDDGLFGELTGTLKNVNIVGAELDVTATVAKDYGNKGLICNTIDGGIIDGVFVDGKIKADPTQNGNWWKYNGVVAGVFTDGAKINNVVIIDLYNQHSYDNDNSATTPAVTGPVFPVYGAHYNVSATMTNIYVVHDTDGRYVEKADTNGTTGGSAYWGQDVDHAYEYYVIDGEDQEEIGGEGSGYTQITENKVVGKNGFGVDWTPGTGEYFSAADPATSFHVIPATIDGYDWTLTGALWDFEATYNLGGDAGRQVVPQLKPAAV